LVDIQRLPSIVKPKFRIRKKFELNLCLNPNASR
jgi:hypothetical protein